MKLPSWPAVALALAACTLCISSAFAEDGKFPYRPIRIVHGFSSGGISDTLARVIGDNLGRTMSQTIVVEPRPGGGGIVAMTYVKNQTPDGYTLLLGNSAITVSPNRRDKPPFNPLKTFVPVSMIGTAPSILLANPAAHIHSVHELIDAAKAHPGKIDCATSGIGTTNDLGVHLLNSMAGIKLVPIPFKGSGPSLTAALSDETSLSFAPLLPSIRLVKSGQLAALGVSSLERNQALPDVATIAESLPGFVDVGFYSIVAERSVPLPIIRQLHKEINATLETPSVRDQFTRLGTTVTVMTRKQFGDYIAQDAKKWADLVRTAHLVF